MSERCSNFYGTNFAIIVVLFILLIIIGAIFSSKGYY